ncbi:putative isomerase YbhE [Auriscalpium vulgare]|uniref:Isomerase YbhE n=1 Tax=Auriscalpium vulgare TaxID=40419 RepID=A0ACB8RXD7_9AGAM|nr:putative isomerase YbhE [Auriscalpium vulgare]
MPLHHILVASYTDAIATLRFDSTARELKLVSTVQVGHHPSWIVTHPDDPSLVFTGLEQADGRILALKYDAEGRGTVVGSISSGGADPASLLAADGTLFIGNYSSGSLVVTPLSASPPYFSDAASVSTQFSGTGPDASRQESSHPHQVVFVPGREELLVPDLGADKTWRLLKQGGVWTVKGHVEYEPGSGPRHVVFNDGILYTLNELKSTISAHRFPPLPEAPTLLHTTSTFASPPNPLGACLAAELLLSSSGPSPPYLYASNRNDPSPLGDPLSIFSLANPEAPALVGDVRSGVKHMRGVVVGGEGGRFVVLGGALGGGVKIYEQEDAGRALREVAALPGVEAPTGFLWL